MSAPAVIMTMNTADFNRVLKQVADASSRTYPEIVNGQAFRLATYAIEATEKADANKIALALGQTSLRTVNKRTGGLLKTAKRVYAGTTASLDLYRIVNWRRKRAGKEPIGGKEMSAVARRVRAATLRSTSFIASGWIYSVRALAKVVGSKDRPVGKRPKVSGAAKGYAIPARTAFNSMVTSEIGNTALLAESAARTGSRKGAPMRIAELGLAIARDLTAKNMLKHIADKLQPVLTKHSAK